MGSLTKRFLINKLNITIVLLVSIVLSIAHFVVISLDNEGVYSLTAPFSGNIPGSLAILQWIFFLMTNLFGVYIVGVFYERLIYQGISSHIIRYQNKNNWVRELEVTVILGALAFSLIYIVVSFILGILAIENATYELRAFVFFALLWALEMLVVAEIFITLCVCIKNSLASFVVMLIFYMMVGLPPNISCYIPFGISSVSRMEYYDLYGTFEISLVFIILIITFLIAKFVLYRYGKNRIFNI